MLLLSKVGKCQKVISDLKLSATTAVFVLYVQYEHGHAAENFLNPFQFRSFHFDRRPSSVLYLPIGAAQRNTTVADDGDVGDDDDGPGVGGGSRCRLRVGAGHRPILLL